MVVGIAVVLVSHEELVWIGAPHLSEAFLDGLFQKACTKRREWLVTLDLTRRVFFLNDDGSWRCMGKFLFLLGGWCFRGLQ